MKLNMNDPIYRQLNRKLGGMLVRGAVPNKHVHRVPRFKAASTTGGFKLKHK